MAERLTPQTLDLEVRGSSLAHHIVFLDKKMGTGNILLGVTLPWTRIPSRGGVAILLGMLHAMETGMSSSRLDLGSIILGPNSRHTPDIFDSEKKN